MRNGAAVVLALTVATLLAGCGSGGPGGPPDPSSSSSSSSSPTGHPPSVDGQAVYDWVKRVVTKPDGAPHFRVPGTPDHAEAARWLAEQMRVPGWTVAWQNFTGQDYMGLEKGEASVYYASSAYCSDSDRARLSGLSFNNLVATLPGPGDKTLLLAAHWDSKAEANRDPDPSKRSEPVLGANDGASGVGVLLQLLWELTGKDLPYTVQVVFFDGEDGFEDCHPLAGSLWFVDQAAPGSVDRMLLLDMVGDPDARFIREAHSEECDPALVDLLHSRAARHGLAENFPGTRASVQDDHVPFTQAGIPAVDLIDFGRGFPPYWHTTHDTMENLDAGMLGRVASLVLDVLQDPGFSEPWPGPC
jgi:Zn-dependent M28 family amino/carboxypeptidase